MSIPFPDAWTHDTTYAARYQTSEQIADVIDDLVLEQARSLLDIGCGNGAFAIAAAQHFPNCQICAIDPLQSATEECEKRMAQTALQNVSIQRSPVECLPFPDNCIDRLLMRNVIHHLRDIQIGLKEACRVLSPNGLMLIEAPCNIGGSALAQLISDVYFTMDPSHRRTFHTPDFISSLLNHYGVHSQFHKIWQQPSIMSPQMVSLLHESQMADQLQLQQDREGQWIIQLNFMRVIAQKNDCVS